MVASDLAITKGNRNIVLELATLGVPSITISHGLNRIDDIRTLCIETNATIRASEIDSPTLARKIDDMLSSPMPIATDRIPTFQDGVVGVAKMLAQRSDSLSEEAFLSKDK